MWTEVTGLKAMCKPLSFQPSLIKWVQPFTSSTCQKNKVQLSDTLVSSCLLSWVSYPEHTRVAWSHYHRHIIQLSNPKTIEPQHMHFIFLGADHFTLGVGLWLLGKNVSSRIQEAKTIFADDIEENCCLKVWKKLDNELARMLKQPQSMEKIAFL